VKEIVVVAKDKVGLLADISDALGNAGVNIEGISADVVGENAVVKLVVDSDKKGKAALEKVGYNSVSSDTLVLTLDDQPGELSKVSKLLAEGGVNISNVYMLGKEKGQALVAIKVDKFSKAKKIVQEFM